MLLSPYRVFDASGPLGFLTGRILGDLGADVIKVEPPGGDPSRAWPPFHERNGVRQSLFWAAHNANKRGITLDLESRSGQFVFRELARTGDVVIESFAPGHLARYRIRYDQISHDNPRLSFLSVPPH